MQIFVKLLTGKTISLNVQLSFKLSLIKTRAEAALETSLKNAQLIFAGVN